MDKVRQQREEAQKHNLRLISYEGGQHMVGVYEWANNPDLTRLLMGANRDQRMRDLYLAYLKAWQEAGGSLFVHFQDISAYNKHGSWGLREWQDELSPKAEGLLEYWESRSGAP